MSKTNVAVRRPSQSVVPETVSGAKRALALMYRDLDSNKPYDAIRKLERMADAMRVLFAEVVEVRCDCEKFIILANHRYGRELLKMPVAKGQEVRSLVRGKMAQAPCLSKGLMYPPSRIMSVLLIVVGD